MDVSRIGFILLLFNVVYADVSQINETESEDRQPRVNGRIVKLYSGTRPEPIYCPQEGFQADPVNCAIFYRCIKGANNKFTVFRFQCGPGTVYDPDTEVCNFPQSTKRSECGGISLPSANENEIEGTQHELPVPIYSRPAHSEPSNGNVSNTLQSWANQKKSQGTTASHIQITTSNQISSTNSPMFQTLSKMAEGETCKKDGFMGDSQDCRKFYRCVGNQRGGFMRYEFSCSETTVWDDEVQNCNHPWAVQKSLCGKRNYDNNIKSPRIDYKESNEKSSQEQLQINYGEKVTQVQTQISHGNVMQNQTQINYGDKSREKQNSAIKQNQTQISHGSAVSQTQSQINYGNGVQSQLQIDHSKESSQSQSQTYETTSKVTSSTTQQYDEDQGYDPQQSSQDTEDKDDNESECTESGFMGDKNDCKKFYRCVDNGKQGYTRYEFSCGEGTVWDSSIEGCNHAWAVKNCNKNEPQNSSSTTTKTTQNYHTSSEPTTSDSGVDNGYDNQNQQLETTPSTTKPLNTTQTTTTTAKPQYDKDNKCKSSGFMGDENDCKKFYRCVDNGKEGYTRYEFSCGEGTVWDPKIEGCNHVWAVEKCGGSTNQAASTSHPPVVTSTEQVNYTTTTQNTENSGFTSKPTTSKPTSGKDCTQEGFMGDESDCKKFYRCVDNGKGGFIKYEFSCGDGTVWDSEITACNHPSSNIHCGTSSISASDQPNLEGTTEPSRENDEMHTESTNKSEFSTEKTQSTVSSPRPQMSDDKCTSEGFYGNSNNCKMFYRCVNNGKGGYTKYEFTCGEGTIWDQEIQTCNHEPSDSKCSKDSQNSETQTTETGGDIKSTPSSSTEELQPTQKPQPPSSESSNNCSSEGFYANTKDCKKFYRCVDNGKGGFTKYDFSCGEGTVWVQEIQACDHDDGETCLVQNEYSSSTTEAENVQSSGLTTQQPDKQNDENPNQSNSETESSDDARKCTAEGFYPNENDCKKFYRCVDNGDGIYTKYDFDCGEGTAWDSDIKSCNHIDQVKSCQGQTQESAQPMHDEKPGSSDSTSTTSTQTSTSGLTSENSNQANKDACKEEGYFGNSQDCTKFYRCVGNGKGGFTKYDFSCGEGTIWDQDITTCNHPQDVSNPSCQQSDNSNESSSSTTSSSGSSSSTTESSSSDCSQGSTKKPENKNVNCTKAGYYPDPDDCKKFYRCVDWDGDGKRFSVYHFDCGEGTIWDPALDTCNHEDSVYPPRDCSGGAQSQGENTTETIQESTTQESTTSEQTTQESSTDQTTTNETTTSQQTTTEQSKEEQTSTQKTTTQQTTSESTTMQESTTQVTTTQSTDTTEHTTSTTDGEQPSTTQQTTEPEGTTTESTTTEDNTDETTTDDKSTEGTTTTEGTTEESTSNQTDETGTTESSSSTTTQSNDSSTTESQPESTTENGTEQTTESNNSEKECPETDDDQNLFVCPTSFRRHPKYCNMFYQCTEDDDTHDVQIATFHCPNNTIYDESKTQCVEEKKADKKCDGEIAQKRRLKRFDIIYKEPIIITNERLKCPAPGHYPFEHGECSTAFLKCQKTKSGKVRGFVYQCPQDYIYWKVSRRCEPQARLQDCKKSHNDWKGRWEIPMERRNVAP